MTTTFDRLVTILMEEYKLQPDRLTFDAPLESLGMDSLGIVELMWNIEDAFHIKLSSEPADLSTLGDVVRYIDEIIAARDTELVATPLETPTLQAK